MDAGGPTSRFGIFGGLFDPPHRGHVAAIDAVLSAGIGGMTTIEVVVCGRPPHREPPVATGALRLAMTRAAFSEYRDVFVSDIEIVRAGDGAPTYMVDTVRALQAKYGDARPVIIVGADQAATLTSWHRADDYLSDCDVAVVSRDVPGSAVDLGTALRGLVRAVHLCPMNPVSASSTKVRDAIAHGDVDTVRTMVPERVLPWISEVYGTGKFP